MPQSSPIVLVTGGAGYIGSHVVLELKSKGYQIIILDNFINGHQDVVNNILQVKLIRGDISDRPLLQHIFTTHKISAVMHFAAYAYVGESMTNPGKYYRNNLVGTLTLLETMVEANIPYLVFSSTCATYGIPNTIPITEEHPQSPINTYGTTKLAVENMLKDFERAHPIQSVIFRYFNAAGADPQARLGEDHDPEPHLIPLTLYTALGKRKSITIFGTDYPTPDGTCIRDYIHVTDLAQAHVLGLEYLLERGDSEIFNLGNGNGFSVKEVIQTAQKITSRNIPISYTSPRSGDPPILVGSSAKARKMLHWNPQYPDLEQIIIHAWQWHLKRHGE